MKIHCAWFPAFIAPFPPRKHGAKANLWSVSKVTTTLEGECNASAAHAPAQADPMSWLVGTRITNSSIKEVRGKGEHNKLANQVSLYCRCHIKPICQLASSSFQNMILLKGVPVKVLLVLQLCLNEFQMPVILVAAPQIFRDRKHFYHWGIADKLRKANSTSLREGLGFCRF